MQNNTESKNKNKKTIFIIIAVVLLALIALFIILMMVNKKTKNETPDDITAYFYEQGTLALEIEDNYIDKNISYDECYASIDEAYQKLNAEYKNIADSSISALEKASDLLVVNALLIFRDTMEYGDADDILDARNRLAAALGTDAR